jgi:hypothetical protein
MKELSNKMTQRTGGSCFCQSVFVSQPRLAPAVHR